MFLCRRGPSFLSAVSGKRPACLPRSRLRADACHTHLLATPRTRVLRERCKLSGSLRAASGTPIDAVTRCGKALPGEPVQPDRYLLDCYRYIEFRCARGDREASGRLHYPSRSPCAGASDELVTEHARYRNSSRRRGRRQAYRELCIIADPGVLNLIRVALKKNWCRATSPGGRSKRRKWRLSLPKTDSRSRTKAARCSNSRC